MAAKKKEGLEGIKDTTGGKRREDREAIDRTCFDPLSIDAKNVLTVVYLLQSPEDMVRLRAIASLEVFGNKDPENLELLCSLEIFEDIYPILYHPDFVARRFALKLIAMLSSIKEFRAQVLKKDNILDVFVDLLRMETDTVLQEFASLTLAELTKEYQVAADLLKVENCLSTLFLRLISADPDIEKNCLDIIIHLLSDINGLEIFIESPSFEMKTILNLISSSYPKIQALVIEVLTMLTAWCRDTRVLFQFRDAMGGELVLKILETREYADLHQGALDLMINVTDCPDMCEYLQNSGCLQRFIHILDSAAENAMLEKIVGVLARMAQTIRGREALHNVQMEKRFIGYLEASTDDIQEAACLGIANLSQNVCCLQTIIDINPMKRLLEITVDDEKNIKVRNMASYALNILSNADKRPANAIVENEAYKGLFTILTDNSNLSTELCQNVIQVFIGISLYHELRIDIISENFLSALINRLPSGNSCIKKDPCLQVDTLECLSGYMIEFEAQYYFNKLDGAQILINCLRSKFASVREWAGHVVVIASQNKEFIETFIRQDGLEWMLKEKNTMYSMPSWQSAIETIFANYLPAKYAYTGRLDLQDITEDGFYISTNPRIKFLTVDYLLDMMISPVSPIYVANFLSSTAVTDTESTTSDMDTQISALQTTEPKSDHKYIKKSENSLKEWNLKRALYGSSSKDRSKIKCKALPSMDRYAEDPHLVEHLVNLKKKIDKEESTLQDMSWFCLHPRIICNRARIIAEFVAEEMSGVEPNAESSTLYKAAHINEIKYYLGTNILPLGLIRVGDYLERAMLFKVLADRTGFPCALVRGPYGRAWIEIAIPVINVEDPTETSIKEKLNDINLTPDSKATSSSGSEKSESQNSSHTSCTESQLEEEGFWYPKIYLEGYKGFPKEFLKPNAIVDLVIQPGRILNLNSYEANEYCGAHLF